MILSTTRALSRARSHPQTKQKTQDFNNNNKLDFMNVPKVREGTRSRIICPVRLWALCTVETKEKKLFFNFFKRLLGYREAQVLGMKMGTVF